MWVSRRYIWCGLIIALAVACQESITAPGACPDYCPPSRVDVFDSILKSSIDRDSSFRGYVPAHAAEGLQLTTQGSSLESRAVLRFFRFPEELTQGVVGAGDSIVGLDSLRLDVAVRRRSPDVLGMELVVHRLPVSVDSQTTYADVVPFFHDSTIIATLAVPDTLASGKLSARLDASAFPTFESDSLRAAVGVALRADSAGFLELGTLESDLPAVLNRFVKVDSAGGETAEGTDARPTELDSYVALAPPSPGPDALAVGGIPSARAILRFDMPRAIVDSSDVVRATLILVPDGAAYGAPGDTFSVRAEGLTADFGPKSPLVPPTAETIALGAARVGVGASDTVRIDITHLVRPWRVDTLLARSLMLRIVPEGAILGEIRFGSSRAAIGAPAIRVTYMPLFPGVSQ
ncbi:MAG: hypothetical protein GTN62_07940 [Gemmatimonadales bacterium]|nr:hypothetical protein [Gemmatimonadales bacterium]NIN50031.1 hypothetical protein [Gemmatimonadales bacterium]NIP07495.1 hypothetical protein [Gemmatimonadales bacterium]NIR03134.1 hypothetical protein [Gemmatimonadales bacterium]NIS66846.1 hypothetical protein [Gemmatimonadales bacterium]